MVYRRITQPANQLLNVPIESMLHDDELNEYHEQLNVRESITFLGNIGTFLLWIWIIIAIIIIIISKSYWKQY